jgi:hypothetical protein
MGAGNVLDSTLQRHFSNVHHSQQAQPEDGSGFAAATVRCLPDTTPVSEEFKSKLTCVTIEESEKRKVYLPD